MNIPQSDTVVHIASVNFFKVCQFHFLNFLFYLFIYFLFRVEEVREYTLSISS